MRHAILGWGSLLWDDGTVPLRTRGGWLTGGPVLPLEFSRVSRSRFGALTLVIDPAHGDPCPTSYVIADRRSIADVICDLRTREDTVVRCIGFVDLESGSERANQLPAMAHDVRSWAGSLGLVSVVWTDLGGNFGDEGRGPFTMEAAMTYLRGLPPEGRSKAKEYVERAPAAVDTPLRRALVQSDWWTMYGDH